MLKIKVHKLDTLHQLKEKTFARYYPIKSSKTETFSIDSKDVFFNNS